MLAGAGEVGHARSPAGEIFRVKARSGSGDAAAFPLPPALLPPVLPEGVEVYGRIFNTLDLTTKDRTHDDPGDSVRVGIWSRLPSHDRFRQRCVGAVEGAGRA
jgi:hypothetical protein